MHDHPEVRKAWIFARLKVYRVLSIQTTAPLYAHTFNYATVQDAAKALHNMLSTEWRAGHPKLTRTSPGVYRLER